MVFNLGAIAMHHRYIQEIAALLARDDTDAANNACQRWLHAEPNAAEANHLLGIVQAKTGNFAKAVTYFEQAILLAPHEAVYYNNLSNAWKKLGNLDIAIASLHTALQHAPNYAEAYNNLGSLYYTQGRITEAIPYFEKSIRLNSKHWEAHFNLANCLMRLEQITRAISHYEQAYTAIAAIDANFISNNIAIVQNLGMAYFINKQYAHALPLLEIACQHDLKISAQTLTHAPSNALNIATNADLQAQLAEVYLELGNIPAAITQFKTAINADSGRPEWLHNLAILHLRQNERDSALHYFKRTLELQPENATAQHMSLALANLNSTQAPPAYVASLFDQYAQFYNKHMRDTLEYKVPELLRSMISNNLRLNKSINILDLGCGTGLCSIYFRDIAKTLVGVDLSNCMLAHAKSMAGYDLLCQADIKNFIPGVNHGYFDLILSADVLVYCGDLETIFANCHTALTTNGCFAFSIETIPISSNTSATKEYTLSQSGRFVHSKEYIVRLTQKFNYAILDQRDCVLRKNSLSTVDGTLFLIKKI